MAVQFRPTNEQAYSPGLEAVALWKVSSCGALGKKMMEAGGHQGNEIDAGRLQREWTTTDLVANRELAKNY